jgi:PAS domain S-box-containing protein
VNRASVASLRLLLLGILLLTLAPLFVLTILTASRDRVEAGRDFELHAVQFAEIVSLQEREMMERGRSLLLSMSDAAEIRALAGGERPAPGTDDARIADEYLARQLRLHPEYLNIGFADTTGRVWCSAIPLPGIVMISDREYFRRAVAGKGFSVGVYQVGRITGKPSINLGHAVLDSRGDVAGVVFLASDLRITDQISGQMHVSLPEAVAVTILDRNGTVLARHAGDSREIGTRAPEIALIKEGLPQGHGIVHGADSTGTHYLHVFSRVSGGVRSGDAYVLLTFLEEDAYREINAKQHRYLVTLVAVAAAAILLGYLAIVAIVIRPARALLRATARLSTGDLSARAGPPYGGGEVGALSIAFDRMAEALQQRQEERDRAEAALRVSEANYRSLVNEAPYGIVRADADGRLLEVNPAAVKMFGYDSEEDLKQANARDLYCDPEQRAELLSEMLKRKETTERSGVKCRRKDGSIITIRLAARWVMDESGTPLYMDSVVVDETERYVLEQQLAQAQKMEAVGRLAGGIAHDFNNLLGVILGHSDLILQGLGPDAPNAHALREVRDAAAHGAALTRQLLGFSRIQLTQPAVLDINAPVASVRRILDRLIGENYTLRVEAGADLPTVCIDPIQVEQITMNLVINARDAMPDGGVITLTTSVVSINEPTPVVGGDMAPGEYVCLKVHDHGVGIEPEVRPYIFEPFFTTKESPRDTGLGLAIVSGIVAQSDGYVRIESEVGHGTTVEIFLPPCGESPAPVPASPPRAEPWLKGSETLLLVEDEEALQLLLSTVLSRAGYRVLSAKNAPQALAIAGRGLDGIDLVVTDVIMPGMGGRELADRLRSRRPDLKVLFISGYPSDVLGGEGVPAADMAYLTKPFTADELLRKVRVTLDR